MVFFEPEDVRFRKELGIGHESFVGEVLESKILKTLFGEMKMCLMMVDPEIAQLSICDMFGEQVLFRRIVY